MREIKLLIVDDVEDNRLVLHAICRKIEGFIIQEASDGLEAIAMCESWQPHIILMDIMMPNLDGFEASKIIKGRFPETIIMAVTAVIDPIMETNMTSIGVSAYVHKPIDKELIRFKLQSFATILRGKAGEYVIPSDKEALNPFAKEIRSFKTLFKVHDAESMMDFGIWMYERCVQRFQTLCVKVDPMIELFYELMREALRNSASVEITIEESFEELYVSIAFAETIVPKERSRMIIDDLDENCIIQDNMAFIKVGVSRQIETKEGEIVERSEVESFEVIHPQPTIHNDEYVKTRQIPQEEKELLRQSFVHKTSAAQYVSDLGGDVLDEILELESLDGEWINYLQILSDAPTRENIRGFVENVLAVYVRAINALFEFTALAYALSSLGSFMKEHAQEIVDDSEKINNLVMMIELLGVDLSAWREHIFETQDAADIHYLDSSFFSSCMQIEQIIAKTQITTDEENDLELF